MSKEFLEWVSACAHAVGLSEWEIDVTREELPEGTLARCRVPRARQYAEIVLGEDFFDLDADEVRETIVHELLHCHFAQVAEIVDETLPALLGKPAYHAFEVAHDLASERCLDAMAVAFASLLPAPPEVE